MLAIHVYKWPFQSQKVGRNAGRFKQRSTNSANDSETPSTASEEANDPLQSFPDPGMEEDSLKDPWVEGLFVNPWMEEDTLIYPLTYVESLTDIDSLRDWKIAKYRCMRAVIDPNATEPTLFKKQPEQKMDTETKNPEYIRTN